MTKLDFLLSLHEKLLHLPQDDVEERLNFYCEMIEDHIEEGLSEEDAVSAVGSIDKIAEQIANEISNQHISTELLKSKRKLRPLEIVLLILGSPLLISLLLAVFAVIISLYITMWSLNISLWAVFGSFAGCVLGGLSTSVVFFITKNNIAGIACICVALVCAGLSIFLFYGCKAATKGAARLTKIISKSILKCFMRKENS